jgi:regulator of cell morphogenesis and NO signaling
MTIAVNTIEPGETLNALVDRFPAALPVLQEFGLDTCCGGAVTLERAAAHYGIDLRQLLEALRAAQTVAEPRR